MDNLDWETVVEVAKVMAFFSGVPLLVGIGAGWMIWG